MSDEQTANRLDPTVVVGSANLFQRIVRLRKTKDAKIKHDNFALVDSVITLQVMEMKIN